MEKCGISLSIIIPVYNVEGYISRCLDSLIKGVYSKNLSSLIEIIIINDGSTDKSGEICLGYKKKYDFIHYLYQENKGLSSARNLGIRNSIGKYLVFVDSDDFINSELFPELLRYTLIDVDLVFLNAVKYYPSGAVSDFGEKYHKKDIIGKSRENVLKSLTGFRKFPGSAWNKMIKRDFVLNNHLFFMDGIYSEDLDWSIRVFSVANRFDCIDGVYYYYCQGREDSITGTISIKNINSLIYFLNKYIDYPFDESIKHSQISFLCYEYLVLLFLLNKMKKIDNSLIKKIYDLRRVLYKSDKVSYRMLFPLVSVFGVRVMSYILTIIKGITDRI